MAKICPSCKKKKGKNLCNHEKIGLALVVIVALVLIVKYTNIL